MEITAIKDGKITRVYNIDKYAITATKTELQCLFDEYRSEYGDATKVGDIWEFLSTDNVCFNLLKLKVLLAKKGYIKTLFTGQSANKPRNTYVYNIKQYCSWNEFARILKQVDIEFKTGYTDINKEYHLDDMGIIFGKDCHSDKNGQVLLDLLHGAGYMSGFPSGNYDPKYRSKIYYYHRLLHLDVGTSGCDCLIEGTGKNPDKWHCSAIQKPTIGILDCLDPSTSRISNNKAQVAKCIEKLKQLECKTEMGSTNVLVNCYTALDTLCKKLNTTVEAVLSGDFPQPPLPPKSPSKEF